MDEKLLQAARRAREADERWKADEGAGGGQVERVEAFRIEFRAPLPVAQRVAGFARSIAAGVHLRRIYQPEKGEEGDGDQAVHQAGS